MSKDKYKIRNWHQYNEGLVQRGAITIWISQEALSKWFYEGAARRGGQFVYSDLAIEVCLIVRLVYHLPLRQTVGFLRSFFSQLKVDLPVPHYSLICRRSQVLQLNLSAGKGSRITDIVVDTTGLKVYGEGEWKVRKYGWGKRRTWMKLHVALSSQDQKVEAVVLSTNRVDDAAEVPSLLGQITAAIRSFTADGAYDMDKVRSPLEQRSNQQGEDILQVIVPQRHAVKDVKGRSCMRQRDEDVAFIKDFGRAEWKELSGYHQRSLAETFMFRYKVIVGGSLRARKFPCQQTEVRVGCKVLNQMLELAKPISEKVA